MSRIATMLLALCLALPGWAGADDSLELEGTSIIGNRELPKVLYIVPWKKAKPGDLSLPSLSTLLEEELEPIDREVFRRRLRYYESLHDDQPE